MFCPTCGTHSEDSSRFCPMCGNPLPRDVAHRGLSDQRPDDTIDDSSSNPARDEAESTTPASGSPHPDYAGAPPTTDRQFQVRTWPAVQDQPRWSPGIAVPAAPLAPFGAPLANWWHRVGALLIDILVLDIPYVIIAFIVVASTRTLGANGLYQSNAWASRILFLIFLVLQAMYFAYLNGLGRGQTIGNRASNIAVRDVNTGEPIGLKRGFLRWFVRLLLYILFIPGIVNDLLPLWTAKRQTIADKAANSVMIRV